RYPTRSSCELDHRKIPRAPKSRCHTPMKPKTSAKGMNGRTTEASNSTLAGYHDDGGDEQKVSWTRRKVGEHRPPARISPYVVEQTGAPRPRSGSRGGSHVNAAPVQRPIIARATGVS